jgi:hypothetical protein
MGLAVLALVAGVVLYAIHPAMAGEATRLKIGTASVRANGCNDSSQSFKFVILDAEKLDRSFNGVLAGLERTYTEANGTRSDTNWAFTDGGSAVTFSLYAKGGGNWVKSPFGGGGVCVGASGANITVEVYAHYKR